ncbi:MAG: M48 family metallopeptidase [Anaerolineae bacterium]|nr:M48 family metallopeptidase [Anaerolineae bacterium]MCO5188144.1 M48 family metallopeptidase [Anaerolineae bacterium]MCO5193017.1 M48 family metallopeptidase [Anaerolineae bacterium]MCO5205619.1 M48 family metallopeptidase [Anaerolineae bacterium]
MTATNHGLEGWRDKAEFRAQIDVWAQKLDVELTRVTFREMRTKWASYSTKGTLTLNTELLDLDREIGNYVIVHELLHDSVPNHGRLWKSLMTAYLGDYQQIEVRLSRLTVR